MPDQETLQEKVAAYLEFQEELGIEGFYRRAPGSWPPLPQSSDRLETPVSVKAGGAHAEVASRVAPPAEANPMPAPTFRPSLAGPAAEALNLFEAPAPKRGPETLEEIRADLGDCHRCKLAAGRKHIVFGQGSPRAQLVFVGEGPGADEDEQGLPFVGRAGQLLNKMIQLIGMKREEVYIANVVKCRPPGNRTPEKDEVEACSPFLLRQIETIRPRLVCCLGAPAMRTLLGISEGISKVRGHFLDYGPAKAFVTFHPAYILRNPREEKILREDFESIRAFLGRYSKP
jgi:uracil-DNA glycosylase